MAYFEFSTSRPYRALRPDPRHSSPRRRARLSPPVAKPPFRDRRTQIPKPPPRLGADPAQAPAKHAIGAAIGLGACRAEHTRAPPAPVRFGSAARRLDGSDTDRSPPRPGPNGGAAVPRNEKDRSGVLASPLLEIIGILPRDGAPGISRSSGADDGLDPFPSPPAAALRTLPARLESRPQI